MLLEEKVTKWQNINCVSLIATHVPLCNRELPARNDERLTFDSL